MLQGETQECVAEKSDRNKYSQLIFFNRGTEAFHEEK